MIAILGIFVLLAIAVLCSESRRAIVVPHALRTLLLQVLIAIVALKTPVGVGFLSAMSEGVRQVLEYANAGTSFIFGYLSDGSKGMILAFQVIPVVIFIASLFSILFYLRIMPVIIHYLGGAIRWVTGASRLESTCAAANVFVGMAEAPLTVLPFLSKLSRAQLFTMMALGLSSVAGTVLVAYAALGVRIDLLLTAAFMAAPGGLLMARILVPETGTGFDVPSLRALNEAVAEKGDAPGSLIEAATRGALTGLNIMLSIIAVLIAFIAIIALLNGLLGAVGGWFGMPTLSFELLMGYVFAPVSFLIGVPWDEAMQAGVLLGEKLILNEFLAYAHFSPDIERYSVQGQVAITVALCGFANFGGLAILLAGLTAVIPQRATEIGRLGLKAVLAGTLSNFMSAAIVSAVLAVSAIGA